MNVDLRGFRVHEIAQEVQFPLIESGTDFDGWYYLDGPFHSNPVQPTNACCGVMIGQSDHIQPRRLTTCKDLPGGEGSVGSRGMYMKIQAHRAGQIRYGNEAEEVGLLASQKSFGSSTGMERGECLFLPPFPCPWKGQRKDLL
jgi:hypothetical protein